MKLKTQDIRSGKWKKLGLMTGDTFTSTKKVSCPFCKKKSDKWVIIGRPFDTPHLLCPKGHTPFIPIIRKMVVRKTELIESENINHDSEDDDYEDSLKKSDNKMPMEFTRLFIRAKKKRPVEMSLSVWKPEGFSIGDAWLSNVFYSCPKCDTRSNLWEMAAYKYGTPVAGLVCPKGHWSYIWDLK